MKEFENEKEKNRALKVKISDMEKEKSAVGGAFLNKRDSSGSSNSSNGGSGSEYENMKSEFDAITKLALSSMN